MTEIEKIEVEFDEIEDSEVEKSETEQNKAGKVITLRTVTHKRACLRDRTGFGNR